MPPRRRPRRCSPYLIAHRSQRASRDAIAFTFWPDDDETRPRANLRRHIALILRALPAGAVQPILADNRTIQWNPQYPCTLDVVEFEQLSRDTAGAADATAVYAGDLLPDSYDERILDHVVHMRGHLVHDRKCFSRERHTRCDILVRLRAL